MVVLRETKLFLMFSLLSFALGCAENDKGKVGAAQGSINVEPQYVDGNDVSFLGACAFLAPSMNGGGPGIQYIRGTTGDDSIVMNASTGAAISVNGVAHQLGDRAVIIDARGGNDFIYLEKRPETPGAPGSAAASIVVVGGEGNDSIYVTNGYRYPGEGTYWGYKAIVCGGAGNDVIVAKDSTGASGEAIVAFGEDGNDYLEGGKLGMWPTGGPMPQIFGNVLFGGSGDDGLVGGDAAAGNDFLDGGPGNDALVASSDSSSTNDVFQDPDQIPGFPPSACRITGPCGIIPSLVSGLDDAYDNAHVDPSRCYRRAREYAEYCQVPIAQRVTAAFMTARPGAPATDLWSEWGVISYRVSRCRITQAQCSAYPNYAGTFDDDYDDSGTTRARCLDRAQEYAMWCQNPSGSVTTAAFLSGIGSAGDRSRDYVAP